MHFHIGWLATKGALAHTHTCTSTHAHVNMHTCTNMCEQIHTYTNTHTHTHTYTHTHTHTHTGTHRVPVNEHRRQAVEQLHALGGPAGPQHTLHHLSALSLVLPKCVSLKEGEYKKETDEKTSVHSAWYCRNVSA